MNPESFRHGMRVRMGGPDGEQGKLWKCPKKDGSGHYWKVKLVNGEWVWPDRMVLDGPGRYVRTCADCELPMLSEQPNGSVICRYCLTELEGTDRQHAHDGPSHGFGTRRWNRERAGR